MPDRTSPRHARASTPVAARVAVRRQITDHALIRRARQRPVSARAHGALDYGLSLLLVALPWIARFAGDDVATWLPVAVGGLLLLLTLCSDHELAAVRIVGMPLHLALDGVLGFLLAVSPWLLGFAHVAALPFLALGVAQISSALLTRPVPDDRALALL